MSTTSTLGPLLVISGPTATGKTAAAVALAEALCGELVSADSVQVYRGFDIGSAKPTADELRGVPHHLLDVLDPNESIDAMGYAALADRAIAEVRGRGKVPIVVGGTGLWLRALLRGLVEAPAVDPELRARLEREADLHGAQVLHDRLAQVDPKAAARLHPNDRQRVVRALEFHAQTGTALGDAQAAHALGAPRYDAWLAVLDVPRDAHASAIETRVAHMLAAGWIDEVRRLATRWDRNVRAFGSVGYRQLLAHVLDGAPLDDTVREVVRATRIYARRQRTWWNNEPGVTLRTTADDLARNGSYLERIREHLRGVAPVSPV